MPKISIIIPVYNAEKYLCNCLDSVLKQSFADWEMLLVDDGSKDSSPAICDEYAAKDDRIRVFHKENGGVSSARNTGVKYMEGEWVYFMDADDTLVTETLAIFANNINTSNDLLIFGFNVFDEEGKVLHKRKEEIHRTLKKTDALTAMYLPINKWYEGYLWSKLFRASVIKDANLTFYEKIRFNEDRLFIVQYIIASKKDVLYDNIPVYNYIQRTSGAMESLKHGYNRDFVTDFDAYVKMYETIMSDSDAQQLKWLAREGIISSYKQNSNMMEQFHNYCSANHWHMLNGMYRTGALKQYIDEIKKPFLQLIFPQRYC